MEKGYHTNIPIPNDTQNPQPPTDPNQPSAVQPAQHKRRIWIIVLGAVVGLCYAGGIAYLLLRFPVGTKPQNTAQPAAPESTFQKLLDAYCYRPKENPAEIRIDPAQLPILVNFPVDMFNCEIENHVKDKLDVRFSDGSQTFTLFDTYWPYDTELLAGDMSGATHTVSRGLLLRSVQNVDQYIRVESLRNRFDADKSTWLSVISVKKDPNSQLKVIIYSILIDAENERMVNALKGVGIEQYGTTPTENDRLMENLKKDLFTPLGPDDLRVLDGQVHKLNQISFR